MSLNSGKLLFQLNSAVLSGKYLTILGNQAPIERKKQNRPRILPKRRKAKKLPAWRMSRQRCFMRLSNKTKKKKKKTKHCLGEKTQQIARSTCEDEQNSTNSSRERVGED